MYTGRIAELGLVVAMSDGRLVVAAPKAAASAQPGGSVAVDGVCLTVTDLDGEELAAEVSEETRHRTTIESWTPGRTVNVEPPLRVGDPLDGHLVQGHVDAVGKVVAVADEGVGRRIWIRPPARVLAELVAKGSIAVDGVSLTVAEVSRDRFSVALVPATRADTTLGDVTEGRRVNLETDLVAKLARRQPDQAGTALAVVVGRMPWSGRRDGRVGVEQSVAQLAAGGGVVVWDATREGEGDVVFAGADLRPEAFVFLLTKVCGHTTIACDADLLERLEIGPIPGAGDRHGTAMHVPVDLAAATGTGVSAAERAATVRHLTDPSARPGDFLRPGHVFPLAARRGGLTERAGHTEATVALCRAAGVPPVGAICEVMAPDGTMAGLAELERFALRWGLPLVEIGDLGTWL